MSAQPERIGVVVVHGVGEAKEGWIDSYLVPDLERWAAYRDRGQSTANDTDRDMMVVVRASDARHLALALDCDAHFKAFCQVTGREDLAKLPQFLTADLRRTNRDALVEAVAAIVARGAAADWLATFAAGQVPACIAFDPQSRVQRVRDPESRDPTRTWKSFTRRWPLDGREVLFTELYWADMSNVGSTIASRLLSIFELVLEAPFFLGRALMRDSTGGIHRLIRWLISSTSWLMRWPVAGLNTAIFMTALLTIIIKQPGAMWWLPYSIAATLAIIAVAGIILCRKLVHGRPGLADLALSASLCSMFLLGLLAVAGTIGGQPLPTTPEPYLVKSILLLLIAWTAWTVPIILAVLLVLLVGLKRLLVAIPMLLVRALQRDSVPRSGPSPPLARPAAAISLNLILAILVKFLFAAFGILVITTLVAPMNQPASVACPEGTQRNVSAWWEDPDFFARAPAPCQLAELKRLLLEISAFNALALAMLLVTAMALALLRRGMKGAFRKSAAEGKLHLPRLIASPLIVAMLFAGALLNTAIIYVPGVAAKLWLPSAFLGALRESGLEHLGAGALIVFMLILGRIIETSDAVLHIGRDLVDHQYDRNPRSLAMRIAGGNLQAETTSQPRKRYRRRMRIQRRLEALIEDVIANQRVDRLIFLAHSQGTVIMRDYLLDHDLLIADRREQFRSMASIKRIDVITLGSPLTHLYKYYFSDDGQAMSDDSRGAKPIEKVKTWTNIWRVDDPIGQMVDLAPLLEVQNRGIAPGGHTYYWKEHSVCEIVWKLIIDPPVVEPPTSGGKATVAQPHAA
ncbi:MAG: CoA transferase [Hyphomicrobiaceae bacterium]